MDVQNSNYATILKLLESVKTPINSILIVRGTWTIKKMKKEIQTIMERLVNNCQKIIIGWERRRRLLQKKT